MFEIKEPKIILYKTMYFTSLNFDGSIYNPRLKFNYDTLYRQQEMLSSFRRIEPNKS